jgi:hypothetical protein
MRLPGWETLPMSAKPAVRAYDDWNPPGSVPAPAIANILGDSRPEIVAAPNDGAIYAIGPDAQLLMRYDTKGAPRTLACEPAVVDLNRDGVPEIVLGTYSQQTNGGRLIVLDNTGHELYDLALDKQGTGGGNGIGVPAAPSLADIDSDRNLEMQWSGPSLRSLKSVAGRAVRKKKDRTASGGPVFWVLMITSW